jgi:chloramphenicol 3-O-phosphotransferase
LSSDRTKQADGESQGVVLVTGVSASGKSTIAQLLAERFPRAVHLRGDAFRRMIVTGREDMGPDPSEAALGQLDLRYRLATAAADAYADAGFTVILQDVVVGSWLPRYIERLRTRPRRVVVLHPRPDVVAAREATRTKTGYRRIDLEQFWRLVDDETPRVGLWVDSSRQSPGETTAEILARLDEALV